MNENLIRQNGRIKMDWEQTGGQHGGDRRSIDYHLTLDTAKELAMVEKNDRGVRHGGISLTVKDSSMPNLKRPKPFKPRTSKGNTNTRHLS